MKENQQVFEGMKPGHGLDVAQSLLSYKAEDLSGVLQSVGMIEADTLVKLSKEDEVAIVRLAEMKLQADPQMTEEDAVARAYLDRMVFLIGSGTDYLEGMDQRDAAKLVSEMTGMNVSAEELEMFKKYAKDNGSVPFTVMIEKWVEERGKAIAGVEPLSAEIDGQDNVIEVRH